MVQRRIIRRISYAVSAVGLILLAIASIEHVAADPWPRIMLITGMATTLIGVLLRRIANRLIGDAADEVLGG